MRPFSYLRRIRGHSVWTESLRPNSLVIDAGAHMGEFSEEIFRRYGCRCILIEANPHLAVSLTAPSGGSVIHAALSSSDGTATFSFADNPEGGSIAQSIEDSLTQSCEVATCSLETIIKETGGNRVSLLKLDIEGSEFPLLESISDEALLNIEQITIEFHDFLPSFADPNLFRNARRRLERLGFFCFVMTIRGRGDVLFLNRNLATVPFLHALLLRTLGRWVIKAREISARNQ